MGRVMLLFICSLIFTLIPSGLVQSWSEGPPDWKTFSEQYRKLSADGKFDLAERLWNSRYPEMEQYVQTLSDQQKTTWTYLDRYGSKDMVKGNTWEEGILTFLEVTTSDDPFVTLADKLERLSERSLSSVSLEGLEEEWSMIRPVVLPYVDMEKVDEADQAFQELFITDSMNGRENFSVKITELVKLESQQDWSAFLLTAMIIGGSILVTLLYVGAVNYRESSKNGHRMMRGSS